MNDLNYLKTSQNSFKGIWEYYKIDDVFAFINGKAFYVDGYSNEGIRVLDLLNINREGLFQLTEKDKFISKEVYKKYPKSHLEKNDLIMIMTDITPQLGLIGKCTIIKESKKYALNQRVGCLRLKSKFDSKVLLKFINYLFNSRVVRAQVINNTFGTAQFYINTPEIKKIRFPLPPLPEQKKIAAILTSVDEVIEKTEAQINKLKGLKKAMMQELLTKGIGHTEFKDSPVGRIPRSWEVVKLKEMADVDKESLNPNTSPHFSFRYIDIASISKGNLKKPNECIKFSDAPSRARRKVNCGDVLMSTVRPNLKAFAYFNFDDDEYIASTGFAVLTPKSNSNGRFILYSILSDLITKQIDALVVGSNYPAINFSEVKSLILARPPKEEQDQISEIFFSIDNQISSKEKFSHQTQSLKKALMQDLLTGKVRVKV